jgi:uncharacterized protein YlxW (UPF0749 family)
MIGDHFTNKWTQPTYTQTISNINFVSQEEFNSLKKEVEEMKELLIKAKIYDEKNNEPNCEMEEKISKLREIAKLVGIDLDEVLKNK